MLLQPENWEETKKILVVLSHPDDPEFFCGATLARWAQAGHEITYCLLTCGDKGFNPVTQPTMTPEKLCGLRRAEQTNAAKVIGARAVHFFDYEDGYVVADLALRRNIVRAIRKYKPDVVVTCDPQNLFAHYGINHPDHRACGEATLDAVFPAAGNIAYFPELIAEGFQPHSVKEIWCSLTNQPNVIIDVTATWSIKLKALLKHKTQIQDAKELMKRMKSRRVEDSAEKSPRYEEKFRVVKY